MRSAHDWGRASGRPPRSATVSRKSYQIRALLVGAAALVAACDSSGTNATDPSGTTSNSDAQARESTRTVYEGVAYPTVTIEPASAITIGAGKTETVYASLSEPNGEVWTSCCSSYTSSDASVASVSVTGYGVSGGERAVVTAHKAGHATITATTQSGTSGTLAVTVSGSSTASTTTGSGSSGSGSGGASGGGASSTTPAASGSSGSAHEPSGMKAQVNTGAITSLPAGFTVYSPSSPSSVGEWSGNLTVVPGGTGLRLTYPENLVGGNSPVRFGVSLPSAGTGWYYQRMKIRFSPNWRLSGNTQSKLCEPRTYQQGAVQGPSENDVIGLHVNDPSSTQNYFYVMLQGPNSHFRDLFEQPLYAPAANVNDGNWHTVEVLFSPESSPGAGNGTYTGWVDGTEIAHYTDVLWLAPGNQVGWPFLMFDPTYGGGSNHPVAKMYWDMDQLYVSTK